MKEQIKNYFALNGVTLIILAFIASAYHGTLLCLATVYEVFGFNLILLIVHKGLDHFESTYYLVELLIKSSISLGLIVGAGALFHWYDSIPIGVLIAMGIGVYVLAHFVGIWCIQKDIEWINHVLKEKSHDEK